MPRKPRTDAVLLHLPMDQQKALCEWLLDGGLSYRAAVAAMEKEFGVQTSSTAVFDFYHTVCAPELLRRRSVAVTTSEEVAAEAEASPGRWDEAALEKLKQRVFEMMLNPQADPKETKALFGLVLKAKDQAIKDRDLDLDERRVAILERKADELDAAKKKAAELKEKGGLTPEMLEVIETQLKLL